MTRWLISLTLIWALALSGVAGILPAAAQDDAVTVFIKTIDAETGDPIYDACYVLVDFSNEGCDENGDGRISFEGVPPGDYSLSQTRSAVGYQSIDPLPMTVDPSSAEQTFQVRLQPIGGSDVSSQAEGEGVTVFIQTVDGTNRSALEQVCYVLVDYSNVGCDDNADGRVAFEGVAPGTTYTVHQTARPDGYLPVGDFPIIVNMHDAEQTVEVIMSGDRRTTDTIDISVVPYDATTGGGLTGGCVVFSGGSQEGCDENGDGRITFEGIPAGSYLLRETVAPTGYTPPPDRWIALQATGRTLYLPHSPAEQVQPKGLVDVALVTRDPETGELLTGACYVILDASVEGCDENDDGQVDYEDVVPGTYTIHQTTPPDGHEVINDFEAQISEFDPTQSILIKQSADQYEPGFRNVSVAVYDIGTGQRVRGEDVCVVLVNFSNEGCDLNSDGQIDFQDVPVGEYELRATSLPQGYGVHFEDNLVIVEETNPLSIANALLVVEEE
jgi:uncharacterized surface anchored protein